MNEHDDALCTCPWHVAQRQLVPNHDEVHAHEDVDWNVVRGED